MNTPAPFAEQSSNLLRLDGWASQGHPRVNYPDTFDSEMKIPIEIIKK